MLVAERHLDLAADGKAAGNGRPQGHQEVGLDRIDAGGARHRLGVDEEPEVSRRLVVGLEIAAPEIAEDDRLRRRRPGDLAFGAPRRVLALERDPAAVDQHQLARSEEHTSELQSPDHLVCRLLLEKKKKDYHEYR